MSDKLYWINFNQNNSGEYVELEVCPEEML